MDGESKVVRKKKKLHKLVKKKKPGKINVTISRGRERKDKVPKNEKDSEKEQREGEKDVAGAQR